MTPPISETAISKRMRQINQRNTAPERIVKNVLASIGAHFRTNVTTLPGRPDIANQSEGWVIMVNGCFWHGHECAHGKIESKTKTEEWRDKIAANRERDQRKRTELEFMGFAFEEVWECELNDLASLTTRLSNFLDMARGRLESFVFDQKNNAIIRRVSKGGGANTHDPFDASL